MGGFQDCGYYFTEIDFFKIKMYKCIKQYITMFYSLPHKMNINMGNILNRNDWNNINIKWLFA